MNPRQLTRWLLYVALIALVGVFLYNQFSLSRPKPSELSLQALAREIRDGKVARITVDGPEIAIERTDESTAISHTEENTSLIETLDNLGVPAEDLAKVEIEVARPSGLSNWLGILS